MVIAKRPEHFDVIIVGAGPAGMSAAIEARMPAISAPHAAPDGITVTAMASSDPPNS